MPNITIEQNRGENPADAECINWINGGYLKSNQLRYPDGLIVRAVRQEGLSRFLSPSGQDQPHILLLSGTSESGKSTVGKLLFESSIASRIKYLRVVRESFMVEDPNLFLDQTITSSERKRVGATIANIIINMIHKTQCTLAVVETIKQPWIVDAFRGARCCPLSVFVDADINLRIVRESEKTGLEAKIVSESIAAKDKGKRLSGMTEITENSDINIMNNGGIQNYESFFSLLASCYPKYNNQSSNVNPIDYK